MTHARERIVRLSEAQERLGVSRSTLWRMWAKDEILPPPIAISRRCKGWPASTIEDYIAGNGEVAASGNGDG